jgi:Rha family phage regulatory protein
MSTSLQIVFSPNTQGFNCITSKQVADLFGREHKNVLQSIAKLVEREELGELICQLSSYPSAQKKPLPQYLLTESGFLVLLTHFNLRAKKDKERRNEILKLFQERSQQLIKRNLQLENAVTKLKEAKGTNGYKPYQKENGFWYSKLVPKEECSELELLVGGLLRKRSIVHGVKEKDMDFVDKITKIGGLEESWVMECLSQNEWN